MSTSWELFETFLAVMRTGSLSAASRTLGVAQPTIRRRIEALEEVLGVVLFTRATNGLVPTDEAHATLPAAEAMDSAAEAFGRLVSGPSDGERGTVRVTASRVVGVEVLPGVIGPLLRRAPGLHLEIVTSDRFADLLRRDADVAIRMAAPTQAALVARRAATIPVGLYASAGYLAGRAAPRRIGELRDHALVGPDRERGLLQWLAMNGFPAAPKDFAVRSDDDLAQLAAVRGGLGIGVCQVPLAARDPSLVRVLPKLAVPLEAWVVMHEDQRRVRRVRRVFDELVDGLRAYAP